MQYSSLGRTGLSISRMALGTWAMGGSTDWGPADDAASLNAVSAALDAGINLFDTAPVYGNGHAEQVLGQALKGRRQQALLATKCGLVRFERGINHWLKPESIRQEVEDSLRRLRTDYIDIYQIHWPDPATALEDSLAELVRLKQAGKIRFIGLCNVTPEYLARAASLAPVDCVQGAYSLLDRAKTQALVPLCQEREMGILAYGVLAGGILSGKYKKEPNLRRADARSYFYRFYKGDAFRRSASVVQRVMQLAHKAGLPPSAIALGWVLAEPGISGTLVGARNAAQVWENVQACSWRPSPQERAFLEGENDTL